VYSVNPTIYKAVKTQKAPFVDIHSILRSYLDNTYSFNELFCFDGHCTPLGNSIVAKYVYKKMIKEKMIPGVN